MHTKECEEVDVRKRMALVEIIRESCTFIERPSNRGSIEGKDGEHMLSIFTYSPFLIARLVREIGNELIKNLLFFFKEI